MLLEFESLEGETDLNLCLDSEEISIHKASFYMGLYGSGGFKIPYLRPKRVAFVGLPMVTSQKRAAPIRPSMVAGQERVALVRPSMVMANQSPQLYAFPRNFPTIYQCF